MITNKDIDKVPMTDIAWLTWFSTEPNPKQCEDEKAFNRLLLRLDQLHLSYGTDKDQLKIWT